MPWPWSWSWRCTSAGRGRWGEGGPALGQCRAIHRWSGLFPGPRLGQSIHAPCTATATTAPTVPTPAGCSSSSSPGPVLSITRPGAVTPVGQCCPHHVHQLALCTAMRCTSFLQRHRRPAHCPRAGGRQSTRRAQGLGQPPHASGVGTTAVDGAGLPDASVHQLHRALVVSRQSAGAGSRADGLKGCDRRLEASAQDGRAQGASSAGAEKHGTRACSFAGLQRLAGSKARGQLLLRIGSIQSGGKVWQRYARASPARSPGSP